MTMDDLRIYIVTYNVATKYAEEDLLELLGLNKDPKLLPDFYLIGLQEVKSQPQNIIVDTLFDDPWTNSFRRTLVPFGYIRVKTLRLVGLVLSLFCLRKHVIHLRDMETVSTKTGLMGFWGNKGGITLRFQIYGCSLCFVNCHLSAHDNLLKERISEYNSILQNQKFESRETSTIMFHDYVFWFGDLNFRLNDSEVLSAEDIDNMAKRGDLSSLLDKDQLRNVMTSGEAFSELIELEPTFPPTYKYLFNSNHYDLKRRSAWTDRILHRVNSNVYENVTLEVQQHSYDSFQNYSASDHKPVVADFTIKVFSNYDERMVKFLPIHNWYINEVNTAVCTLGSDVVPNAYDWVAVVSDMYTSLNDYIGYTYITPTDSDDRPENMISKPLLPPPKDRIELKFHEGTVRSPGKYRLLYFTHDSSSVLGMSHAFQAVFRLSDETTSSYLEW